MPEYSIRFARSARKELEHLDASVVSRIFPKIEALVKNPHPTDCRKLQGFENLWRIRVGHYRVVYQVLDDEQVIDIIAVRHRSQAYRLR
jgi:mRNA interferase RelE/StbE